MREIKFRGKSMGNHWVYGLLTTKKIRNSSRIDFAIATEDYSLANTIPINENTIGQFTGFKDIDDKKIFEGDILQTDSGRIGIVYIARSGIWACEFQDETRIEKIKVVELLELADCKIIGNIHDNPELLGSDKND